MFIWHIVDEQKVIKKDSHKIGNLSERQKSLLPQVLLYWFNLVQTVLKLLTLAYSKSLCIGISLNCLKQYSRSVTMLLVEIKIWIIHRIINHWTNLGQMTSSCLKKVDGLQTKCVILNHSCTLVLLVCHECLSLMCNSHFCYKRLKIFGMYKILLKLLYVRNIIWSNSAPFKRKYFYTIPGAVASSMLAQVWRFRK